MSASENCIGLDSSSTSPEGNSILKPRTTRRMAGRLDDQQFVFGQVRPAMGMGSTNYHLVNSKSFRPSKDVLNFN